MSVVENIKLLCKKHNTSVPKLEKELGFGKGSIYNWDTNSPSVDKVQKVADYFGVSIDFLLDRDEISTIAAHHDGDDWTEEELLDIEKFKEFVRMKRSKK